MGIWLVFFDEGGCAYYVEGVGFAAGGLEGDADGEALPFCGLADGMKWLGWGQGPSWRWTTARRAPSWATMAKRPPLAVAAMPQ